MATFEKRLEEAQKLKNQIEKLRAEVEKAKVEVEKARDKAKQHGYDIGVVETEDTF